MARAIAVLTVALAMLLHGHATATTLRGSPTDMIELQAVDGGVYVRDTLAVYGEPGTPAVDCELGDWEPESECNDRTLTQIFVRKATIAPGGDGATACEDVRETRKCKPVHCEMGPWSLWSDCEEGGYKTRTREQLQGPLYGGRSCPHEIDRVKCRPEDCLVCGWSDWKCDPKTEKKTRTRIVTRKPQLTGKKCPRLEDEADCDPIDCVLDDAYEDEWTECDEKGDRHKYRKIKVPAQYKGAKACPPPEDVWMTEKGACPPVDCEEVDESTVAFGECEERGYSNMWFRKKVIGIKTFPKYGGSECRSESERTVQELCDPVPCVMDEWHFEGECMKSGKRKRVRKVKTQAMFGAPQCMDQEDEHPDPESCPPVDCEEEDASTVSFGECQEEGSSNRWYRKKVIGIKTRRKYGGKRCRSKHERTVVEPCDPVPCVMDEWQFEGECKIDGKRKRTKRVLIQAKYGAAECTDQVDEQLDREYCPPVDCKEEAESSCRFGVCERKEGTLNTWSKRKVIGIETYPVYGGKECRSEAERTVEEVCDPVSCVMDEWRFEGECKENGKRKRVQKVLVQAKYGATECIDQEDEQPDPESCPPVPCEEEDEANVRFGECEKRDGPTPTWTKKKVLSIKTFPRYGGAQCRSESERTMEEVCDPVSCVMDEWQFEGECKIDGKRKRTRKVKTQAMYGAEECSDQEDEQLDPEYCPPVDCVEKTESSCRFGECHLKEGTTNTWSKKKVIGIETYPVYGGKECRSESERTVEEVCDPVPCVMGPWKFEGECTAHGNRKRTRKVEIQALYGAEECSDQEEEKKDMEGCPPVDCEENDASTVEFGECEYRHSANKWYRKKVITIKTEPKYGGLACRSVKERTVEECCTPVPCVMGDWKFVGACDNDGKRKKTREVVSQGMYGAPECTPDEITEHDPVECPATDCVLGYGWTNWGSCINGKKKRTSKINVPAKYGGACVVEEDFSSCH